MIVFSALTVVVVLSKLIVLTKLVFVHCTLFLLDLDYKQLSNALIVTINYLWPVLKQDPHSSLVKSLLSDMSNETILAIHEQIYF